MSENSDSESMGSCDLFDLMDEVKLNDIVIPNKIQRDGDVSTAGPRPTVQNELGQEELAVMRAQAMRFAAQRRQKTMVRVVSGHGECSSGAEATSVESVRATVDHEAALGVDEAAGEEGGLHLANIAAVAKPEVDPKHFSRLAPPHEAEASRIERWDLPGCEGFVLDHVLSREECESLIVQAGTAPGGFSFWDASNPNPRRDFRNADTVEVTHPGLAEDIWRRMAPFMRGPGLLLV